MWIICKYNNAVVNTDNVNCIETVQKDSGEWYIAAAMKGGSIRLTDNFTTSEEEAANLVAEIVQAIAGGRKVMVLNK